MTIAGLLAICLTHLILSFSALQAATTTTSTPAITTSAPSTSTSTPATAAPTPAAPITPAAPSTATTAAPAVPTFKSSTDQSVAEIASENADFSTFVNGLKAISFFQPLQSQGPYTVFIPTNDAFNKLGQDQVKNLMKPENRAKLTSLLTYHIVPGRLLSKDLKSMKLRTLSGKEINIQVSDSNITVNGAKVIKTDLIGSNGVIYAIDTVLSP